MPYKFDTKIANWLEIESPLELPSENGINVCVSGQMVEVD